MPHMLLVAPAGRSVGLTTVCLGLVRALDRKGVRVAFVKPIAGHGQDGSVALMRLGARLNPPEPIDRHSVEQMLAAGDDQTLMEQVVAICNGAAEHADVLVVEGMVPESGMVYSTRVNALMMKALDSELILVASPRDVSPSEIAESVAIAARGYGPLREGQVVGCVLNRVCTGPAKSELGAEQFGPLAGECGDCRGAALGRIEYEAYAKAIEGKGLKPVALVPCGRDLAAPRMKDVARALSARVLREGNLERRRVRDVIMCAMTVANAIKAFKPGVLAITPGDRNDIILGAALAVQGGMPIAGILLTGGLFPDEQVMALCKPALETGLPILSVQDGSYPAATKVESMNPEIPPDDAERVELTMNFVADFFETGWLKSLESSTRVPRLSPPAFRHRLVEAARAADKRIVLPEGAEPRTIAAAAIAQERRIARCVLMGHPDEIREMAKKQGVTLPRNIELLDAAKAAPNYVRPLVEARKHKGMTTELALSELGDTIMIGTMMMALGEADGLVSGAVHTTAHTIRPALQIIKTVPGSHLVSSVFFMCLPDQVLVFGDCAVNPNPNAEQLADIAIQSADSAAAFGIPPRVAMLSYSTGTSGAGEEVEKVKKATLIAQQQRPDLLIDGPLQYDAAIMPEVARQKMPKSPVAGKATVFIFPDLNSGNVTYKAVQRSANVVSIGPMLQGLAKPVNDLSRGCLVEDIVFTIALTAIQAQQAAARKASAA
ncbi:MAG TPA: phosphate acetyltransferase [Anaeromyxobacteraceae bacterium]|nr:phosphate acetyltransferase [Anaeromyxobacteraceae bacterium]